MPLPISSGGTSVQLDPSSSPTIDANSNSTPLGASAGLDRTQTSPVSSPLDLNALSQGVDRKFLQGQFTPPTRTVVVDHIAGESLGLDSGRNFPNADATTMRSPYGGNLGGQTRDGWSLTSALWLRDLAPDKAYLKLHAGPNQAGWSLPIRASGEPTKAGHSRFAQARKVTHATATQNGNASSSTTYFDLPRVSLDFQAGSLLPIPTFGGATIPYGLRDFYRFLSLVNQAPILSQNTALTKAGKDDMEGAPNFVTIFYTSLQFPALYLKGYFEPDGISWTDTADAPTTLNWTASFLVYDSVPYLWESEDLESQYAAVMGGQTF